MNLGNSEKEAASWYSHLEESVSGWLSFNGSSDENVA